MLHVNRQVRPIWKALAKQPIGIFVAAALLRALGITEVDPDICRDGEFAMITQFHPPVPSQRIHAAGAAPRRSGR